MQGSRFCSAISCARVCLRAVIGIVRPALHRRVVADDHHLAALDAADPGDDPGAGRLVLVHPVGGELETARGTASRDRAASRRGRGAAACRAPSGSGGGLGTAAGEDSCRTGERGRRRGRRGPAGSAGTRHSKDRLGCAGRRSRCRPPPARRATGPGRPDLPRPRARRARWRPWAARSCISIFIDSTTTSTSPSVTSSPALTRDRQDRAGHRRLQGAVGLSAGALDHRARPG